MIPPSSMYQLLISAINNALEDKARLTIVLCGELFALPFAAFLDTSGDRPRYLIEKYVLSFVPSIGAISGLKRWSDERDNTNSHDNSLVAIIVGNPECQEKLKLEEAEEEAKTLAKIMEEDAEATQTLLLIGENATVESVMGAMDISNLIHIAAHDFGHGIHLSLPWNDKDEGGFDDMTMNDV